MSKATKYDYMFKLRYIKGNSITSVTLTRTENKPQAMAKFRAACAEAGKDVRIELLDHDGSQVARNW